MDRRLKIIWCLTLLIMGSLFAIAIPALIGSLTSRYTLDVDATIVDSTADYDDGTTMYSAVYEYTVEGKTYRVESSSRTSWEPKIGEVKTVRVDPNEPDKMMEMDFIKIITMVFRGIGGLFYASFLVILFVKSKKIEGY